MALNHKEAWRYLNSAFPPSQAKAIAALVGVPVSGVDSSGFTPASGYIDAQNFGDDIGGRKTVLTLNAAPISISDDAGVAQYGGIDLGDFPSGLILTEGVVVDGSLTLGTTGTIIAAYTGVMSIGTVTASTGSTLTSTEADILQSTAITQAAAAVAVTDAVSVATALTESGARWLDGTATAKGAFLNFAIADDVTHTAGTGSWTGTITIHWKNLGDK